MRSRRLLNGIFVIGLAVGFSACGDTVTAPVEPEVPEASAGLLSSLFRAPTVEVVHRSQPLATDEVVSMVIGREGGTIRLPEAGFAFHVPRWALREPTEITITAPAGELVGYHMEPHGLRFRRSAVAVQDLTKTELPFLQRVLGGQPVAAYFQGDLAPRVQALEILDLNLWGILGIGTFRIDHFSGYVIATD